VALPFKVASSSFAKQGGIIRTCTAAAYTIVRLAKPRAHDYRLHCCAPGQTTCTRLPHTLSCAWPNHAPVDHDTPPTLLCAWPNRLNGCRLHCRAPGQIVPWDVFISGPARQVRPHISRHAAPTAHATAPASAATRRPHSTPNRTAPAPDARRVARCTDTETLAVCAAPRPAHP
jgi:hypothetical protein